MGKLHLDRFMGMFMLGDTEKNLVSLHHLKEATSQDVALMRKSGMNIDPDEKIYTGEQFDFITPYMQPLIVTRNGKVTMITAQCMLKDKKAANMAFSDAVTFYTQDVGKPTIQKDNQAVWDLPNTKIVVGKRSTPFGLFGQAVNIVLSCVDPDKLPELTYKEL